MKKYNNSRI